nr:unnamed protein product [Callosobruchus analis]
MWCTFYKKKNYTQKANEHSKFQLTLLNKSPYLRDLDTLIKRFALSIYFLFNKSIFELTELITRLMSNKEIKGCIICLDEMSLKSHLFYDQISGFQ